MSPRSGPRPTRSLLRWLLLGGVLLRPGEGKVSTRRVKMGLQNVMTRGTVYSHYVAKFGFDVGIGTYAARLKSVHLPDVKINTNYDFEAYMDEEWPTAEALDDVCERKKHARRVRPIKPGQDGGWGPWVNGTIKQHIRPHLWYYRLSECSRVLENRTMIVVLDFVALQEFGSHFPVESKWASASNVLVLVAFTLFLFVFWIQAREFLRRVGELHPVILALGSAAFVQYAGQGLHTGHLALYSANGMGSFTLEMLSEILLVSSQIILSTLMILIAMGYTLLRSKLGGLEFVLPIGAAMALIHIFLVIADHAQSEVAYHYTDHSGLKGWLLVMARLCLFAWFHVSARGTASKAGLKMQQFMQRFRLAAALHFLAYPVIFVVVRIFAEYWQKPIMDASMTAAQLGSNLWLARLFLTRSEYFEVSSLNSSPLPGAGSPRRFYKDD